ncbi:hypothetical protein FB45DRAFT_992914 [Roridomyces roridus]|uniref:Uncharacterized protein n=1 Tax=Roridomyces roridus TaxID=1738132 RepID=A0AAD7BAY2_9AGAR|nr:hypothetical protein FB45DRAFT_992914 [Roridomyces roridus]
MSRVAKYASLTITLGGGFLHSYLTLQLVATWRTLRALDAENELDAWKLDGLKVLWALLAVYLQAAAFISFVGFSGVIRNKPSHLRIYRDYSVADLAFSAFLTTLFSFFVLAPIFSADAAATFRVACEELARQPELAQLLLLLSPDETCERWFERAALGAAVGMAVLTAVRLHFLLAVTAHYRSMCMTLRGPSAVGASQSIRLLPLPPHISASEVVYAPVHCPTGSPLPAAECWVRAPSAEMDAGLLDASVVQSKREWL